MQWHKVEACPLCGCVDGTIYGQGQAPVLVRPDILGGVPLAVLTTYWQCVSCGLIFQNPRLDDKSIDELYRSGDYRQFINDSQEHMDAAEKQRQERIAEFVPPDCLHLDVGSSRGFLLDMTKAKGCTVLGIEPNAGYNQSDHPVVDSLEKVNGQWDCITCIHVLEHVTEFQYYANWMTDLLKPGGLLILEVPSDQSPGGPLRLYHLYHFQPWVISKIFAGLELEKFDMTPHNFFMFRKPT
jgi:SAM-dependent methyltransferase